MFNFANGIPAVVKSLKAIATELGFESSAFYGEKQVAISRYDWNILADFEALYLCATKAYESPKLIICTSPEEIEKEYLNILQGIAKA